MKDFAFFGHGKIDIIIGLTSRTLWQMKGSVRVLLEKPSIVFRIFISPKTRIFIFQFHGCNEKIGIS